jgi:hypothetical protein
MPTITNTLKPSHVRYGLLYVPEIRRYLPPPDHHVVVIDADGERFDGKMHTIQPRIDRLTALHRKHDTQLGDKVVIEVAPSSVGTVKVRFEQGRILLSQLAVPASEDEAVSEGLLITPSLESMLEDFIVNNLSALEPGLTLYKGDDGIPGRQFPTDVGDIDLLCVDAKKRLAVVELKRGRESDRVVGQIQRYIGWVEANLVKQGNTVRGIIIVHKPTDKYPFDQRLHYAVQANPKLELRYYEIRLSFLAHNAAFDQ